MDTAHIELLSVPEAADLLRVRLRDIRTMMADRRIIGVRVDGVLVLAKDQFVDRGEGYEPLGSMRGTLTMLTDAGFSDDESFAWLYQHNAEIGSTPMEALRAGRHRAVRRVIAGLAF